VTLYVDSSALLKRYVDDPESNSCTELLAADTGWVTARHTWVEVLRNLSRLTSERDYSQTRDAFLADWRHIDVVELDNITCGRAADFAVTLGARTLGALHLAAAHRVGGAALPFLTYDLRQAQAARSLGWTVLGV
jgi:predicted nucleic acid-binding protein